MSANGLVIFDVDGVLLDLTEQEETGFFRTFELLHGLTGLSRDWDSYRIRNDCDIIAEILESHFGRAATSDEIERVKLTYLDLLVNGLRRNEYSPVSIPGAWDLLSGLADCGIALGIATSNLLGAARLRLEHQGLWSLVRGIAFGAEPGGHKREILARALAAGAGTPGRIVYVGDNLNDLEAGAANGVHFIGFSLDPEKRQRLRRAGAANVSASHAETFSTIWDLLGDRPLPGDNPDSVSDRTRTTSSA